MCLPAEMSQRHCLREGQETRAVSYGAAREHRMKPCSELNSKFQLTFLRILYTRRLSHQDRRMLGARPCDCNCLPALNVAARHCLAHCNPSFVCQRASQVCGRARPAAGRGVWPAANARIPDRRAPSTHSSALLLARGPLSLHHVPSSPAPRPKPRPVLPRHSLHACADCLRSPKSWAPATHGHVWPLASASRAVKAPRFAQMPGRCET